MRSAGIVVTVAASACALGACAQQRPRPAAAGAARSVPAPATAPADATLANPKIAPIVAATARKVHAAANATATSGLSTTTVHVNAAGQIQVYVHVARLGPDVEAALRHAGGVIERGSAALHVYQVWAAPAALARMAALSDVIRITPPSYGFTRHGAAAPGT